MNGIEVFLIPFVGLVMEDGVDIVMYRPRIADNPEIIFHSADAVVSHRAMRRQCCPCVSPVRRVQDRPRIPYNPSLTQASEKKVVQNWGWTSPNISPMQSGVFANEN